MAENVETSFWIISRDAPASIAASTTLRNNLRGGVRRSPSANNLSESLKSVPVADA